MLLNCIAAIALSGFGPPKLVDREIGATIRLAPSDLREWYQAAQPPTVSADALLVYDVDADRILYSRAPDAALPPASLTKLMTALLALERGQLDDNIEIVAEDLVGGAAMGLAVGDVVTAEALLWGLLVPSGNDAAMALARHIGGDIDSFTEMMNATGEEIGLEESHFSNPHGLDVEGHVSSARDMLTITLRLLEYPLFREIVGTAETVTAGYPMVNTNELLARYPGVEGIKTGTTVKAGQCLVANINDNGHELIIIVLGSDDRYSDVAGLHTLYAANYKWADGNATDLSVLNRLYGKDGQLVLLKPGGEPPSALLHRWGDPGLVSFRSIDALDDDHHTPSQIAGSMRWRLGDDLVGEQPLTVR